MIAVGKTGKGVSGCVRYVLGEGRDPDTGLIRPSVRDSAARVEWIGGQGFEGWTPHDRSTADLARKVMEFSALNQTSKTRPCEKDCLHLILSWRKGERPSREEMEQAAREALGVLGMKKARALFASHRDTDHAHLHIVASRINPKTGKAFRDSYSFVKLQKWALQWEQRHGRIQCPARMRRSAYADGGQREANQAKRGFVKTAAQKGAGRPPVGGKAFGGTILRSPAKAALWGAVARLAMRSARPALVRSVGRPAAQTDRSPCLAFAVAAHAMCAAQRIDYKAARAGKMAWVEYFRKWENGLAL